MKNIQLLVTEQEIHDFLLKRWKTDIFKNSHETGGFINDVVVQFAKFPRLFCETTNDQLERAHFSTWWNAMMLRDDYTNPVIADLYQLHEIYHAATMPYLPGLGADAYDEKMTQNELGASVLSEIQVYFEMPGLREASFNHPIYADRYLADPNMQALWHKNKSLTIETLRLMRRNVMIGKPENEMDITERWIRKFADQNVIYGKTWRDRYDEVERHMAEFQNMSNQVGRKEAIDFHRDWLEHEASKDPEEHIPFRVEAELFTAHYWANKKKFSKAMDAEANRLKQHMVTDVSLQAKIAARVTDRKFEEELDCSVHALGTVELAGGQQTPLFIRHAVDAVITDSFGHVVLVTRENNPGAGLKALPGIFLRQTAESVENPVDAVFRAAALKAGIKGDMLQGAEVTALGPRLYNRPFDIRTAWDDMLGTAIKRGDIVTVSTQGFNLHLKGDLSKTLMNPNQPQAKNVYVTSIDGLTRDQLGIDDHLALIKSSKMARPTSVPA